LVGNHACSHTLRDAPQDLYLELAGQKLKNVAIGV
jgi:hypothetical protein